MKTEFQKLLEKFDYETRSYSGRNMYGEKCLSFVTSKPYSDLISIGEEIGELNEAERERGSGRALIEENYMNVKMDNMGLDFVLYWPEIPFVDSDD